jgi:hypothetical protein
MICAVSQKHHVKVSTHREEYCEDDVAPISGLSAVLDVCLCGAIASIYSKETSCF